MSRSAKPQNGRRRFLRDVVRTAGGLAAVGVALGLQQQTARASGVRLRPPGAINENAFASACVRCGQCAYICPQGARKLLARPAEENLELPRDFLADGNMKAAYRFEHVLIF